ncbi:MAG: hypothetical protein JJD92_02235 [Frankiaceae bacterium]|nr:hypothetical protein [Frankiaceae bacterium]
MNLPPATFAAVAPPTDGLILAFTSARRRRNSKAGVTALGGAVAIAAALSLLAPAGQILVQEPLPPARGGLLPGVAATNRPSGPSAAVPPSVAPAPVHRVDDAAAEPARLGPAPLRRTPAVSTEQRCPSGGRLACFFVGTPRDAGGTSVRGNVCPSAVSVTVESSFPVSDPVAVPRSRTITAGTGSCEVSG